MSSTIGGILIKRNLEDFANSPRGGGIQLPMYWLFIPKNNENFGIIHKREGVNFSVFPK